MNRLPFVSVIVPVYNAEKTIEQLIRSLIRQSYPSERYEIIIVDNNSTDNTEMIIKKFAVRFFRESKVQSSYAARNKGIHQAHGEIFAFIDSDCVAAEDWIEKGIDAMYRDVADLVGGRMNFIFSGSGSAAEFYDAITHLDTDSNIKNMQAAPTVNLFVKSGVFKSIGLFPEVRSGGDMQFTHKAVMAGHKLVYAHLALVMHPTRNFREMIIKSYRVGTGCIDVLLGRGTKKIKIIAEILRDLMPQSFRSIRRCIKEKGTQEMEGKLIQIFLVGYFCRIVRAMGMLSCCGRLLQSGRARDRIQGRRRTMNVLVAILKYPPDFTGAGLRTQNMYTRLKGRGDVGRVVVLTTSRTDGPDHHETRDGIDIFFFAGNAYPTAQRSLFRYLRKSCYVSAKVAALAIRYFRCYREIDIIHTIDSSWVSTVVGWLAFLTRKPLVKEIVLIGTDDPLTIRKEKGFLAGFVFLFPFTYARLIVTISEPLRDICIKAGLPAEKIWTRHNPVYTEDLAGKDIASPVFDGFAADRKNIIFVGTIIKRKNIDFLLESAVYLDGNIDLLFAGPHEDEEYFCHLQRLASRVKEVTGGRVNSHFLGWVRDRHKLACLFTKSDLSWFASSQEGMGNVIIESLLYGTPVVTLPVCGIMHSLIQSSQEGEVVDDTANPEAFASVVNRYLYAAPSDRKSLIQRSRMRFDPAVVEKYYMEHFNSLTARDGA